MQPSLLLAPVPVVRIPAGAGRRSTVRRPVRRGLAAPVASPRAAPSRSAPETGSQGAPAPSAGRTPRASVVLQVIREGTGLAGLAVWAWACLRLLGGA